MLTIGISCYPSLGGSGVVATELGKMMAERGHQVHMISFGMPFRLGKFYRNIYYHEVEVSDYYVFKMPPYDLSLASKMAQIARTHKLDILHVHYAIPFAVCAFLAKQMVGPDLKIVTTLHGTDVTILAQDHSMRDLIRLGIDQSDAVTAVSEDLIRETRNNLAIDKPIERLYNFIDTRLYYPRVSRGLREDLTGNPHRKVLMHVSNFRPLKRAHEVLDVFSRLRDEIPLTLVYVGEGPELMKIMQMVQDRGWRDEVYFLGKQDDVSEVIASADVLMLPSEKESFGLVALEAMACGVPVVGTWAGGIPEVVEHGITGFLAPIGDVDAFTSYTRRLLLDDELRASFGRAGYYRAKHQFSAQRMAEAYEKLYFRVIGSGGAP